MKQTREPDRQGRATPDPLRATGHLLRRANQWFTALWSSVLANGPTAPQATVLALLAAEEPLDQQTVGERGGLDKSTCGYLIDRLDRAGLIRADFDPANRRRKLIHLTPEGRTCLEETLPSQRQIEDDATAALNEAEKTELNRLLVKMLGLRATGD
jgi:DNA-binding MarR family transcriptional regulator